MEPSSLSSDSGSFGSTPPDLLLVVPPEVCHEEACAGSSKFVRNRRPDPGAPGHTRHERSPARKFSTAHELHGYRLANVKDDPRRWLWRLVRPFGFGVLHPAEPAIFLQTQSYDRRE